MINAEFLNCPIEISVDNHTLTVISSDGNDFKEIKGMLRRLIISLANLCNILLVLIADYYIE